MRRLPRKVRRRWAGHVGNTGWWKRGVVKEEGRGGLTRHHNDDAGAAPTPAPTTTLAEAEGLHLEEEDAAAASATEQGEAPPR